MLLLLLLLLLLFWKLVCHSYASFTSSSFKFAGLPARAARACSLYLLQWIRML
eukprot:COSAG06_NODE_2308_length_7109_cov_7.230385_3_plen_53_part_00